MMLFVRQSPELSRPMLFVRQSRELSRPMLFDVKGLWFKGEGSFVFFFFNSLLMPISTLCCIYHIFFFNLLWSTLCRYIDIDTD